MVSYKSKAKACSIIMSCSIVYSCRLKLYKFIACSLIQVIPLLVTSTCRPSHHLVFDHYTEINQKLEGKKACYK